MGSFVVRRVLCPSHPLPSSSRSPFIAGDIGAIGRLTVLPNEGVVLDLKGDQYGGTIIPCASFMVVGFQPKEARVEAVVSDFVQVSEEEEGKERGRK
jgi:hypothetical protein